MRSELPGEVGPMEEPPALAELPEGPGRERLLDLIGGAREEGSLFWRATLVKESTAVALAEAFRRHYGLAGFEVSYDTNLSGLDFVSRTVADLESARLATDVVAAGVMTLLYDLLERGEVLRYESPEHRAYGPAVRAGIAEPGYWAADAYTFVPVWNKEIIPSGLRSWTDLLSPDFEGKITVNNVVGEDVTAAMFLALKTALGREYWEKMAELNPIIITRSDVAVSKVVSGERPVCMAVSSRVYQAAEQGLPVDSCFPEEGVLLIPFPWVILSRAPHPNAAKLWVDYVFSKRGQQVLQRGEALLSGREDFVPPPEVARYAPPLDRVKAIPFNWREYTPQGAAAAKADAREILSAAM